MRPVFTHQPRDIADQEHEQHDDAGDIDGQDDVVQAVEVIGVLCAATQQKQRNEHQADAGGCQYRVCSSF